ncbi:hypothetical protein OsccyDRAFT_0878 [Leptolyngbyaceae cyanobacterium JSC-12]|nr:hypothetical protein OsccyDRAFT_0878 [Leptolyngbyaceae cyanobacterium JSC-12]
MIGHSKFYWVIRNHLDKRAAILLLVSELANLRFFGSGIMSQQREVRRAAAQAFMESLEQLQQTLESADDKPKTSHPSGSRPSEVAAKPATQFDLNSWEDAIADIEQFISQQNNPT